MGGYDDYYRERTYPEVHNWLFMQGPLPVISIVAAYLVFVFKVGPDFMAKRKPYSLQAILVIYNLFLALYSLFIVTKCFTEGGINYFTYEGLCKSTVITEDMLRKGANITWWYFMGKIFELADTVFFVLRKKHQQVTFLHVYHHSIMVLVVWYIYKYVPCEQASVCLLINSFVHIFMYTYYMLAALGPRFQKYLWWKKYVTLLQLVQFSVIITYCACLLLFDCIHPKIVSVFFIVFESLFWYLFAKFYYNSYIKKVKV
ncbi:very long chain fatty acid elongase 4-like isoform X1 [Periplaneta americana]|uniref:very long chain fatty acid elongase 4-like isoform X1 n=1 Tax=Periplaneta americana TaxID=6978 RepID=UPI0037E7BD22